MPYDSHVTSRKLARPERFELNVNGGQNPYRIWRRQKKWHGICVGFSRSLPSNAWWQTKAGWQTLSRPSAAEGGGRRPAFTGFATQPYSATEVERLAAARPFCRHVLYGFAPPATLKTPRFVVCRLGPITSCEVVEALTRKQGCQRELQGVIPTPADHFFAR